MAKTETAIFSALIFLFAAAPPSIAYETIQGFEGGSIKGSVRYTGKPPPAKKIEISRDKKVCGKEAKYSESLIVGKNGGIQNAVLYLADIKKGKKAGAPAKPELDQNGCQFKPHVFIVPAGTSFELINSDGILHNFRTESKKNPILNKAQPKFKKRLKIKFDQPETVHANCDVHEWMKGWVVVTGHPYYVLTNANGDFTILDVPPGTYVLKLWHETLGEQTRKVTVKAGAEAQAAFELKGK